MSGDGFRVDASIDNIRLVDNKGEIVYWDRQEWVEDPDLVVGIANAIDLGHRNGGQFLRDLLL